MSRKWTLMLANDGTITACFDDQIIIGNVLAKIETSHKITKIVVHNDGYFTTLQGDSSRFTFTNVDKFVPVDYESLDWDKLTKNKQLSFA